MDGNTQISFISGPIDVETAWNIGKAVAEWLAVPGHIAVVCVPLRRQVGSAVVEGVLLQGRDALWAGDDIHEAKNHAQQPGCAGAVAVGQVGDTVTIEVYQSDGSMLSGDVLQRLQEQAEAGNFVPARAKGILRQ